MILSQYAVDTKNVELEEYLAEPAPEKNHGEGSGDIFKKCNIATLKHCREQLKRIHYMYADWPITERQLDMMLDSLGQQTINRIAKEYVDSLN